MKTCSNCNELNGDGRTSCWKCSKPLAVSFNYRKICPKCGTIYSANVENCSSCHTRLGVYDDSGYRSNSSGSSENAGCWMYVVSVLIPLLGIILGLIYIARGEDETGKSLIITGVVAWILLPLIAFSFGSCGLFFL